MHVEFQSRESPKLHLSRNMRPHESAYGLSMMQKFAHRMTQGTIPKADVFHRAEYSRQLGRMAHSVDRKSLLDRDRPLVDNSLQRLSSTWQLLCRHQPTGCTCAKETLATVVPVSSAGLRPGPEAPFLPG